MDNYVYLVRGEECEVCYLEYCERELPRDSFWQLSTSANPNNRAYRFPDIKSAKLTMGYLALFHATLTGFYTYLEKYRLDENNKLHYIKTLYEEDDDNL